MKKTAIFLSCLAVSGVTGFVVYQMSKANQSTTMSQQTASSYDRVLDSMKESQSRISQLGNLVRQTMNDDVSQIKQIDAEMEKLHQKMERMKGQVEGLASLKSSVHGRIEKLQALVTVFGEKTPIETPTTEKVKAPEKMEPQDKGLESLKSFASAVNENVGSRVATVEKKDKGYSISMNGQALLILDDKPARVSAAKSAHVVDFWKKVNTQFGLETVTLKVGSKVPFSQISALTNYLQSQFKWKLLYVPTTAEKMNDQIQIQIKTKSKQELHASNM